MKQVDDDIPVIQDNPAPLPAALASPERYAETGHEFIHGIRQSGYLVVCAAGGNDHMVAKHGKMRNVQCGDILGLPVIEKLGETKNGFLILHGFSSLK
jgi:hypothetical protein